MGTRLIIFPNLYIEHLIKTRAELTTQNPGHVEFLQWKMYTFLLDRADYTCLEAVDSEMRLEFFFPQNLF